LADRIWVFVAYLSRTGLADIEETLLRTVQKGVPIDIVCGLDQCISEPQALWVLHRMFKQSNANLWLVERRRHSFHPKIYCFFETTRAHVVIGSANLTHGGLETNIEGSLEVTVSNRSSLAKSIARLRRSLLSDVATPATPWTLAAYEKRYEIRNRLRREADTDAHDAEIEEPVQLNVSAIDRALREYRSDLQRREGELTAEDRYKEAAEILGSICDGGAPSKSEFLQLYGKLVGTSGEGSYWHSAGLQRAKHKIARRYRGMVTLLRKIRDHIYAPPGEVFALGRSLAEGIEGLGVNALTEAMITFDPKKFAVLNRNPLAVLESFGHPKFRTPGAFRAEDYSRFVEQLECLREHCGFEYMTQVDDFLNFVFQRRARARKRA
jgi:HKD family nuclease